MTEQQSGGQLSELALIVARLSETVARQGQELCQLRQALTMLAAEIDGSVEDHPKVDLAGRPIK